MNVEEIRDYALSKENVTESFPFGEETLVFKSNDKIFLLIGLNESELRFNVKCSPESALALRDEFPQNVFPGFHMNKKHWNTIVVKGLKTSLIKDWINDSYELVQPKIKKHHK